MTRRKTQTTFEFDENDNPITGDAVFTGDDPITEENLTTDANIKTKDQLPPKEAKKTRSETGNETEDLVDSEMLSTMILPESDGIVTTGSAMKISNEDVSKVVAKVSQYKDIAHQRGYIAIAELFRIGGANAGATSVLSVPVNCPIHQTANCFLSKYDVCNAMQIVLGQNNIRRLAEAMAPTIIVANLQRIEKNSSLDLKGDLANRINRKLMNKNQPMLTQKEQICCCTYSQWMPSLDTLAESKRLKSLLEEDLASRKKNTKKDEKKKTKKNRNNR